MKLLYIHVEDCGRILNTMSICRLKVKSFILMHMLIVNLVSSQFYFFKYCEYESFDVHVDC